jgi:hypothetical protein
MIQTRNKVRKSIKQYQANFAQSVTLYATDDEMMLKFIKEEFCMEQLFALSEVKTEYRPVDIPHFGIKT